jgi:hypothetical protein
MTNTYVTAIFGVDPGMSTGIAWAIADGSFGPDGWSYRWYKARKGSTTIVCKDLVPEHYVVVGDEFVSIVEPILDSVGRVVYVQEGFVIPARAVSQKPELLSPVRLGTIFYERMWQLTDGVNSVFREYTPAFSKESCPDERLRRNGAWIRGRDHERDAFRLVIAYMRNEGVTNAMFRE